MKKSWLAWLLAMCGYGTAHGASFDCSQARSKTEKLVCGNAELSELDTRLGKAFTEARQELPAGEAKRLTQDQLRWLRNVRNPCADVGCLKTAYTAQINVLDPFADMNLTCEEMRRWPRRVFAHSIDLGSGYGSPIKVDYSCRDSLDQRGFMKVLLQMAEDIRSENAPGLCTGSLMQALWRYYHFSLAKAGMSPKTMTAWPSRTGRADWKSFEREDDSGTAIYFRQWSEQSHFNANVYSRFIEEFDKVADELTRLYSTEYGLSLAEAQSSAKRALSLVVGRAAGSAPKDGQLEDFPLLDLLRAGAISPAQAREADYGAGAADLDRALRVALIHNQSVEVIAALEERLPREGVASEESVPEPLLSLALGHLPNLEYLLRKQYPIDAANGFGKTALFYAVGSGNHEAVELLLRAKADPHRTYKSAQELRSSGFGCTFPNLQHTRRSILMHAAQNSDVLMLRILLEAGASLDARDDLGYNAYDYAVMGKRQENARYLASLGLEAAVPKYSADLDSTVREQPLLAQLEIDGYVAKLAVAPGRDDLLVASVNPWGNVGSPSTGMYLISIARPDHPQIVGRVPDVIVHDFALSPDGKRIYFIELSNQRSPADRKYGLSVVDSSDPTKPSLLTQVEGDFMTMHLSPDGRALYLQERRLKPVFSRGLLVYDVSSSVPIAKCSNRFQVSRDTPVFAYGFASFPDEPLLAIANQIRNLLLFDVKDPCAPRFLMNQRAEFTASSITGGAGRTLVSSSPQGLNRYRLGVEMTLQASLEASTLRIFHVSPATGISLAVVDKDVAVLRTTPKGTYAISDRFRIASEYVGGVVSTSSGHVYIGWKGGLGVGVVPLH